MSDFGIPSFVDSAIVGLCATGFASVSEFGAGRATQILFTTEIASETCCPMATRSVDGFPWPLGSFRFAVFGYEPKRPKRR